MKNTLNELWQLLGGLYGGFLIGILYRLFSLLRIPLKGKWINLILDILFYVLAGNLLAFTMLLINGGEFRLFILVAIAGGMWLFVWVSRDAIKTILKIYKKLLVKKK